MAGKGLAAKPADLRIGDQEAERFYGDRTGSNHPTYSGYGGSGSWHRGRATFDPVADQRFPRGQPFPEPDGGSALRGRHAGAGIWTRPVGPADRGLQHGRRLNPGPVRLCDALYETHLDSGHWQPGNGSGDPGFGFRRFFRGFCRHPGSGGNRGERAAPGGLQSLIRVLPR